MQGNIYNNQRLEDFSPQVDDIDKFKDEIGDEVDHDMEKHQRQKRG